MLKRLTYGEVDHFYRRGFNLVLALLFDLFELCLNCFDSKMKHAFGKRGKKAWEPLMFLTSWSSDFVMQISLSRMSSIKMKFKFVCNVKFPEAN